ncbi:MAG: hypothetical protein K6T59_11580 [Bryobacteraceae bacterium]|nr:hypothetical protein [Bryobacteraceae bacterium]
MKEDLRVAATVQPVLDQLSLFRRALAGARETVRISNATATEKMALLTYLDTLARAEAVFTALERITEAIARERQRLAESAARIEALLEQGR